MKQLDHQELKLWPHQRSAVEVCIDYFRSASAGSALVQYPTGTGKTGIMAVLATIRARSKPVLVVCPSAALVDQLEVEIRTDFWERIEAPEEWKPEQVKKLLPSTIETVVGEIRSLETPQRVVVVGTIQALQNIHASASFDLIANLFGTVLFDEGHREPAPAWAIAVRNLRAKTVLFSATPFRNDLKAFDVDLAHVAFLSFEVAARDHLIRDVDIRETLSDIGYVGFARQVIDARDHLIEEGRFDENHKVIVRTDSAEDVRALHHAFTQLLAARKEKVLSVHDTFTRQIDEKGELTNAVPRKLRDRSERFLIHQFMLTEGIDDPSCVLLAIHQPFTTERQLVQQAGRLTRHPGPLGDPVAPAVMLSLRGHRVGDMWRRFLSFDRACVANGNKPPMRNNVQIAEELLKVMPDVDYVGGKFRTRLEFSEDVSSDLRVPLSAIVFQVEEEFDFEAFSRSVSELLNAEDRGEKLVGTIKPDSCRYHLSLSVTQTPYLFESLFQSASLEITIYARHQNFLFVFDSGGLWLDDLGVIKGRLAPALMRTLLPNTASAVTAISMKNSDLGPLALRSRSMTARSLERSGVFVGEQLHVVTSASGRVEEARRHLGFARGRVREGEGTEATAAEFVAWTAGVAEELRRGNEPTELFGRFATPTTTPKDVVPVNILVDLDGFTDDFQTENNKEVRFDLDNVCVDVSPDPDGPENFKYSFPLGVNGETYTVWMKWDGEKQKFWTRSDKLSQFKVKGKPKVSLVKRLNQQQPFRIILDPTNVLYAFGHFYRSDVDLSPTGSHGALLLSLITSISGFEEIESEKGELNAPADTWPNKSLFGFIDAEFKKPNGLFGSSFPHFLCDDLGDETADFIGADPGEGNPRAMFIAAKWKAGTPGVSASNLYDVCSQVIKNLAYLKVDAVDLPASASKWGSDWSWKGGKVQRIRMGTTQEAFRAALTKARAMPSAKRVFWMALGGGVLSRSKLEAALKKPKLDPEALQLYHLVLSTYSACQSVGVDLRLFSSP